MGTVQKKNKKGFHVSNPLDKVCFFLCEMVLIQNRSIKTKTHVTSSHFITSIDLSKFLTFLALLTKLLFNSGLVSLLLQIKSSFFVMAIIHY